MIELNKKQQDIIAPAIARMHEAQQQFLREQQNVYSLITLAFPEWDPTVHTYKNGQITSNDEPATPQLVKES